MLPFLALLGGWKAKAIAAGGVLLIAAGLGIWIAILSAQKTAALAERDAATVRLAEAQLEIDRVAALNAQNEAELDRIAADYATAQEIVRRQSTRLAAVERAHALALGAIRHANPADNCPLPAPVIDGLRGLRAATSGGHGDGDPAGTGDAPSGIP